MNTPLVLLDLFDTFCLSKKLLRFFLQLTFEARAPVVWGAGEGKHLSQPDVQKEGPLLFLSLESVCGPSAAPLQTAYLSLPGFSHLYCAVVCSPKSRSNGSSGSTHAAGLAQRGVPRDGFNRYGGLERERNAGANFQCFPGFCISTSHSGRSFQHAKGWSWLLADISGVGEWTGRLLVALGSLAGAWWSCITRVRGSSMIES